MDRRTQGYRDDTADFSFRRELKRSTAVNPLCFYLFISINPDSKTPNDNQLNKDPSV